MVGGFAVCNRPNGPEHSALPREAFIKEANAICQKGDLNVLEAGAPMLKDPTSTLDQWVNFYLEHTMSSVRYKLHGIDNLDPPKKDRNTHEGMLTAGRRAMDSVEKGLRYQGTAFLISNGPNPFTEFDKAARKLKLTDCVTSW
jgi:hypothetical protein